MSAVTAGTSEAVARRNMTVGAKSSTSGRPWRGAVANQRLQRSAQTERRARPGAHGDRVTFVKKRATPGGTHVGELFVGCNEHVERGGGEDAEHLRDVVAEGRADRRELRII